MVSNGVLGVVGMSEEWCYSAHPSTLILTSDPHRHPRSPIYDKLLGMVYCQMLIYFEKKIQTILDLWPIFAQKKAKAPQKHVAQGDGIASSNLHR